MEEQAPIKTPEAEPQEFPMLYFMAAVSIYYEKGGVTRDRRVNVLVNSHAPYINERTIANIQRNAQMQAMQTKKIPEKAKIVDVIIDSVSMLGQMTVTQFREVRPEQADSL